MQPQSPSGLKAVPYLQWGSHLAHFFRMDHDLRNVLVPYFKAGIDSAQQCLWVTGKALNAEQARSALRAAVPDLDKRERDRQIEIIDGDAWYATGELPRPRELVDALLKREHDALQAGYEGFRVSGNCAWVSRNQWADFLEYENLVQTTVFGRRMICLCSYCVDQLHDGAHTEIMECHDLAVPSAAPPSRRQATPAGVIAKAPHVVEQAPDEHELRQALQRQKRWFDLAMLASDMGAWRYTLADNICEYDANAQRLYGLTQARFLHDEEGVKAKFHPDDLEVMWARVARALDPKGDGRYEVEYRVKQLDGSWRWLSAWGVTEFEGDGEDRRPVAITGASRDLTRSKEAEDLQRLLLNELNHRVKNTLATIQAITAQTLRGARDLPSARDVLDRRIRSLADAHDLLTARGWTGANLQDLVRRALEAFAPGRVSMSGPAHGVSPKHALALSLALHELATNAVKYGALSWPEGRVEITWTISNGVLRMDWVESGGPPVTPPSHKGFGRRLLEDLIARDLGGTTSVAYDVSGVRCRMTVRI